MSDTSQGISVSEALEPGWLTQVIDGTGTLGGGQITEMTVEPLRGGSTGEVARLRLTTRNAGSRAPSSMVVKLLVPGRHPRVSTDHFAREVRFYRELAHRVDVRVPRLYHVEARADARPSLLVLEDMVGMESGDVFAGCTPQQAELVVRELASLHGTFWCGAGLEDETWVPRLLPALEARRAGFEASARAFLRTFGHRVPAGTRTLVEQLADAYGSFVEDLAAVPQVLAHGDANLGNVLFPATTGRAVLIDWQLLHIMPYSLELSRFVVGALSIAERRRHERALLRTYREELLARGVEGHPLSAVVEDYRRGLLYRLAFLVRKWAGVDPATAPQPQRAGMDFELDEGWLFAALGDLEVSELLR